MKNLRGGRGSRRRIDQVKTFAIRYSVQHDLVALIISSKHTTRLSAYPNVQTQCQKGIC
jgi:hypothetical protein